MTNAGSRARVVGSNPPDPRRDAPTLFFEILTTTVLTTDHDVHVARRIVFEVPSLPLDGQ